MLYRFTNVDNKKTAVFKDSTCDGRPLLWGETFQGYHVLKAIEELIETDKLWVADSDEPNTLCIKLTQNDVDRMIRNIERGQSPANRGPLYTTIKKLTTRKKRPMGVTF